MKTYLVTGACGFIGSNFVHYLLGKEECTIIAVDNLSYGSNKPNLDDVADRITFHQEDIANYEGMLAIYQQHNPDYIVNFAAESHNDRAILDPSGFARSNALGAQVMLEASRKHGVKRHLHVSTIEVYGEMGEDPFTEGSALNAKTPYSAAKAAGDMFVRAYMQTYRDMDIMMTHCANNYGAYQFPEKLIPVVISKIMNGGKAPVYGDGMQRRDWLHVVDHCRAIDMLLHAPKPTIPYEAATQPELLPIYDISARHEIPNIDIVTRIIEALGKKPADCIEYVADRPNHDRRYLIDPVKIETEIGWEPTIGFDQGIADTVRWYVDNQDWLQAILDRQKDLIIDWSKRG